MAGHEENSDDYDSSCSSITALGSRRSCISDTSFGSSSNISVKSFDSLSSCSMGSKPHKAHQAEWEAMGRARAACLGRIGLDNFLLIRRLGSGDLGNVYLCQLRDPRPSLQTSPPSPCLYAMKVVDREALAFRKKLQRAETEREILRTLDHPFLPTLYADFDASHYSCLVMEFCSGGDLHVARQRQPGWRFSVASAKFYAAETILALEYLHMMGVIYRDLKPENVLVRDDGHIMLSDFDLSLKCEVVPKLVREKSDQLGLKSTRGPSSAPYCVMPPMQPVLSCFYGGASKCTTKKVLPPEEEKKQQQQDKDKDGGGGKNDDDDDCNNKQMVELDPELVAEPSSARSKSFVGTHEYLAPEVIAGAGHGSAVDWWTLGVFLYEMIYGRTPFKGENNEKTLINILKKPLSFPSLNAAASSTVKEFEEISKAQDLIRKLLVKNPKKRLGGLKGSVEVKRHEFFKGVNWALIRSVKPPEVPRELRNNNRIRVQSVRKFGHFAQRIRTINPTQKKLSKKEKEEPFQIPQSIDYF